MGLDTLPMVWGELVTAFYPNPQKSHTTAFPVPARTSQGASASSPRAYYGGGRETEPPARRETRFRPAERPSQRPQPMFPEDPLQVAKRSSAHDGITTI